MLFVEIDLDFHRFCHILIAEASILRQLIFIQKNQWTDRCGFLENKSNNLSKIMKSCLRFVE